MGHPRKIAAGAKSGTGPVAAVDAAEALHDLVGPLLGALLGDVGERAVAGGEVLQDKHEATPLGPSAVHPRDGHRELGAEVPVDGDLVGPEPHQGGEYPWTPRRWHQLHENLVGPGRPGGVPGEPEAGPTGGAGVLPQHRGAPHHAATIDGAAEPCGREFGDSCRQPRSAEPCVHAGGPYPSASPKGAWQPRGPTAGRGGGGARRGTRARRRAAPTRGRAGSSRWPCG